MLKIKVQWYLQYQIQSNKQLGTENFNKLKSSGKEKGLQIFFFPRNHFILLECGFYITFGTLFTNFCIQKQNKPKLSKEHSVAPVATKTFMKH